jgi:hypothetical protein
MKSLVGTKEDCEECIKLWDEYNELMHKINELHLEGILKREYDGPLSLWEFQFNSDKIDTFKGVKLK